MSNTTVKKHSLKEILNQDSDIVMTGSNNSPRQHQHLPPVAEETPRIVANNQYSMHPTERERDTSQSQNIWTMGNYPHPGSQVILDTRYSGSQQISDVNYYYYYGAPYPPYHPSYYSYPDPYRYDGYSNCNGPPHSATIATPSTSTQYPPYEAQAQRPLAQPLHDATLFSPRTAFPPSLHSTQHQHAPLIVHQPAEEETNYSRSSSVSAYSPIFSPDSLDGASTASSSTANQQTLTTTAAKSSTTRDTTKHSSFASTKPKSCKLCCTTASSGNWYRNVDRVVGGYICKSCYVCINRRLRADPQESLKTIIDTMNDRRQVRVRPRVKAGIERVCCGYDEECGTTVSSGDWYKSKRVEGGWNCQRCYQRMKKMRKVEVV